MLDKVFDKAEEMLRRMNQALGTFEKEFNSLKGKFDGEFNAFGDKLDGDLKEFRSNIDGVMADVKLKMDEVREEMKNLMNDQSQEFDGIVDEKVKTFENKVADRLVDLGKNAEQIVERLKQSLKEQYDALERKARDDAQKTFEEDMGKLFEKYGDKFAPHIMKSLVGHILRFGKKK